MRARALPAAIAWLGLALGLMVLAPGAVAASGEGGFAITPTRVDLSINPGGTKTRVITVTNTQSRTLKFKTSFVDYQGSSTDPNAAPVLLDGQVDSPISAADWMSVGAGAQSFTLAPGKSKNVKVTVKAPSGSTGGHYAAVVFSSGVRRASANLQVQSRVGTLFLINAGGSAPPEIVIEDVVITDEGVDIVFENDGQSHVTPEATVNFQDSITGRDKGSATGTCSTALPGAQGRCTITASEPDGVLVYDGEVELSNGGRSFRQAVPPRVASGVKAFLLPLAGVGLFAGYFVFLRRRSTDEDDSELMLAD